MSVGFWVVLVVFALCVSGIMGLKPKTHEVRLGKLRLLARQKGLIPKLIPPPNWLPATDNSNTPKLITCYTLIDDGWQLPLAHYTFYHHWQKVGDNTAEPPPYQELALTPFIIGMTTKANSISVYIHDEAYNQTFKINDDGTHALVQAIDELITYLRSVAVHIHN